MLVRILLICFSVFSIAARVDAQSLVMIGGNGQIVSEFFSTVEDLVVEARDASGARLPGVTVTWSAPITGGSLTRTTSVTDANGRADTKFVGTLIQPGVSFLNTEVTAASSAGSVMFVVTTVTRNGNAPPPLIELIRPTTESRTITGPAGTTIPGGLSIRVVAQGGIQVGQPIPNVGLRIINTGDPATTPSASCNAPGGVVLTNAQGIATCDVVLNNVPGSASITARAGESVNTPFLTLTITPGTTCNFVLSQTNQSFGSAAAMGTVNVTAAAGCTWTAVSSASFISITGLANGNGNGTVAFSVAANTTGAARSGTIAIAGQTFTVAQNATPTSTGLSITTAANLPNGSAGVSYSTPLAASGGTSPYAWTLTGGAVPQGLSLSSAGVLSGTPTTAGSYNFTATVTDATSSSASRTFSFTIFAAGGATPVITTSTFPAGAVGTAYQQQITSSGGCQNPFSGPPRFSLSSETLPPGLSIQNGSGGGQLSGTPATAGTYPFTLTVMDTCGGASTASFSITINQPGSPGLQVSTNPASLTFQMIVVSSPVAPADQTLAVNGPAGTNYTAAASTATGGNWLSILSGASGAFPGSIVVRIANQASLVIGSYTGAININSTAGNTSIPVTLTVSAPAASLMVTPNARTFTQVLSAPPVSSGFDIFVTSSTGAAVQFAVTTSGGNWLSATSGTGNTPDTVHVSANPVGLSLGTYNGTVTITPANGSAAVAVPVTFQIVSANAIAVSPAALNFVATPSQPVPSPLTFTVTSAGAVRGLTATVSTQSGGNWLSVSPPSGPAGDTFTVSVNPGSLPPGTYTGSILVATSETMAAPQPVLVNLTVSGSRPAMTSVTNAASFTPGPVAPGEIVVIFGSNLGPASVTTPQLSSTGFPTQLGGTQVTFDGNLAPVIYTSSGQVAVVVPYEAAGRVSTRIELEYRGQRSDAIELRVAEAVPAIFTQDASGQGAILNQDFSVNTPQNGAEAGSVVSIYATGEGQTDPRGVNGRVTSATDLAKPKLAITATIGGESVDVLYAGSAPGLVAGALQVNARIPRNATPGSRLPVVISVGGVTSQANVFVSVR